jgi:hypothetical protein
VRPRKVIGVSSSGIFIGKPWLNMRLGVNSPGAAEGVASSLLAQGLL